MNPSPNSQQTNITDQENTQKTLDDEEHPLLEHRLLEHPSADPLLREPPLPDSPLPEPADTQIARRITCPRCDSDERERIHRKWWMKLIPHSRQYLCVRCYKKYITFRQAQHINPE